MPDGSIKHRDEFETMKGPGDSTWLLARKKRPGSERTILNRSEAPVTALLIGVDPRGGYEPMGWA